MAQPLVADALWERIEPLIPKRSPSPRGGRPRIDDRKCLAGILFVLKTGIAWQDLPREMGCGSGMTCWRRLREWQQAGVWEKLHAVLLAELNAADKIDWQRAAVDSSSIRALFGGPAAARTPRTGRKTARNTIFSSTGTGFRWRPASRRPTPTTSRN